MFLKGIVLQGFKSFAQRVELLFPPGVTAIVGPNGSGKSNVSDAIRWVLGEQNIRNLRGAALQDVIFAGTDGRKPLGMAEVSLTLNNEDATLPLQYAEITITRRTYRSGESEFFINRTPCRLRDIHDLLMDSGLGRGTLSIIGQGEVDAVLSARAEERRQLIEEAAGITRYRTQREAAMARLRETEQDLLRVNDIVAEVERQLEPLAKEAARAQTYKQLRARLNEAEHRLALHDWSVRHQACQQLEQAYEEALTAFAAVEQRVKQTRLQLQQAQEECQIRAEKVDGAREALVAAEREAERADAQSRVLGERIMALDNDLRRLQSQQGQQTSLAAQREIAIAQYRQQLSQGKHELDQAKAAVQQAEEAGRQNSRATAAVESELNSLRARLMSGIEKMADAEAELKRTAAVKQQALDTMQRLDPEWISVNRRLQSTAEEQRAVEQSLEETDGKHRRALQLQSAAQQRLSELQQVRQEAVVQMEAVRGQLTRLRSQYEALRDLHDSFEGFNEGVRACLRARESWRDNVLGAIGTLLDVAPEHELALEIALGAATQNIVVTDEQTAQQAIDYLKKRRAGRVTFLPLSSLRVSPPVQVAGPLQHDPELVGVASHIVTYDTAIQRAVHYLLGRVLITKSLPGALRLNRQISGVSRIVTLEGELVLAAGPITGGHNRRTRGTGMLTRSRRLSGLTEEMEQLTVRLQQHESAHRTAEQALNEGAHEVKQLEEKVRSAANEIADLRRQRDILAERATGLNAELKRLAGEREAANRLLESATADEQRMMQQLSTIGSDKVENSAQLAQLEGKLEKLRQEKTEIDARLSGAQQQWAQASGTWQRLEREVQLAEQALSELATEKELVDREHERVSTEREAAQAEQKTMRAAVERWQNEARWQTEQLARLRKAVEEAEQRRTAIQNALDEAGDRLTAHNTVVHKAEIALERERVAYGQVQERLRELELDVPLDPESAALDDATPWRQAARRLRRELNALGDVNVHALEEHATLKERHEFLVSQRDDLLEAKHSLDHVIADLDETSRERLVTTFAAIQEALKTVFPRLFGGGYAELQWTDADNPLESGIDMTVRPPGKRPQSLLTLSGGERALAAASILFAIMTVRPSPFFVLDEVDAALDESNVERFAQLLAEYGRKNQIIVITHRQGTMEKADALFGVTTERQGASQLVSLRMEDILSATS